MTVAELFTALGKLPAATQVFVRTNGGDGAGLDVCYEVTDIDETAAGEPIIVCGCEVEM